MLGVFDVQRNVQGCEDGVEGTRTWRGLLQVGGCWWFGCDFPRKTKSSSLRLGTFQDLSLLAYALASCSGITWMTADCSLHYPSPFPTFFSFPVFWSQEQRTPLQDGIAASKEGAGCASAALGARRQRVLGELLPSTGCVATFSFYRCFFLSGIACFLLSLLISFSRYLFSTTTYFLLSLLIFFYR
jgi:hypothetical protein